MGRDDFLFCPKPLGLFDTLCFRKSTCNNRFLIGKDLGPWLGLLGYTVWGKAIYGHLAVPYIGQGR
jgi:hypothetical protein